MALEHQINGALRDINRALNGQYAPGSTIKAFLGLAALEAPAGARGNAGR
jgi:cell division protein FtsI/penicillin-binding protein 2